jgi:hypothetical protein
MIPVTAVVLMNRSVMEYEYTAIGQREEEVRVEICVIPNGSDCRQRGFGVGSSETADKLRKLRQ